MGGGTIWTKVLSVEYDAVTSFQGGIAWVRKDGKWGSIDKSGNIIIPLIYAGDLGDTIPPFSLDNGLIIVQKEKEDKRGVIDKTGAVILPFEYDVLIRASDEWVSGLWMECSGGDESVLIVQKDGVWGIIDVEKLKA